MRILGIDPGTATTGYAIVDVADDIMGREFEYDLELLDFGCINTSKDDVMTKRLVHLYTHADQIIEKYHPDMISIEMLFFGANSKTAISVGQARGVIMLSAGMHQIPIAEYTGLQVKLMVAGSGKSDKREVHEAVRKWLGTNGFKRPELKPNSGHWDDATDAIAIAICHILKLAAK